MKTRQEIETIFEFCNPDTMTKIQRQKLTQFQYDLLAGFVTALDWVLDYEMAPEEQKEAGKQGMEIFIQRIKKIREEN